MSNERDEDYCPACDAEASAWSMGAAPHDYIERLARDSASQGRAAERAEIVAMLRAHIASHKAHERKMSYHETAASALTTVLRLVEARGKSDD